MKRWRCLRMAAIAYAIAAGCSCDRGDPAWRDALARLRAAKDAEFSAADSPLAPARRATFRGLRYFAPNPDWNLRAVLEPVAVPDTVALLTSKGTTERYLVLGRLHFQPDGKDETLVLYQEQASGTFFLPFTDATTGRETYGAGRYIDPEPEEDGGWRLDFNRAYNPYCAYDARWVCPVAPPDNHLKMRVEAGEKTLDGH